MAFNVRSLRTARDLTQEKLAVDAGVAAPYISRIEQGLVNPTVDVLDRLAAGLGVAVDRLLQKPEDSSAMPEPLRAGRKPKAAKAPGVMAPSAKPSVPGNR